MPPFRRLRGLVVAALVVTFLAFSATAMADAPYRETTGPAPADAAGAVLVVHGGGWSSGPGWVVNHRFVADRFNGRYATVNTDYAPTGDDALSDLEGTYDDLRARMAGKPICLIGLSAGGHYALMLAERRPDVACVIVNASPTLLTAALPAVQAMALAAFGYQAGTLERWSPALRTDRLAAPVLLAYATDDPLVGFDQATAFADRYHRSALIALPPGPANFVHSQVDPGALERYYTTEQQFVADTMSRWARPGTPAPPPALEPPAVRPAAARPPATSTPRQRRARRPAKNATSPKGKGKVGKRAGGRRAR